MTTAPVKSALVLGCGGFIGHHLVKRLKREGFWVRGVDLKFPSSRTRKPTISSSATCAIQRFCRQIIDRRFDEVYQLAADMGGAGYIFTGENDADVMHNSATINLNVLDAATSATSAASSTRRRPACTRNTTSTIPTIRTARRTRAYPAAPDSEYGWEKLFSERLYPRLRAQPRHASAHRALSQHLRARRHLGRRQGEGAGRDLPQGRGGADGGEIEIWGDGKQTRSFLYIDECLEGTTAADAVRLRRAGEHRLRGDGDHQPAGRHRRRDRRQDASTRTTSPARSACAAATPTIA